MRREDLADLAAFLAVAEERSFTRAAAKLGTSQSALSHTLRKLEDRLGIRLQLAPHAAYRLRRRASGYWIQWLLQSTASNVSWTTLASFETGLRAIPITTPEHAAQTVLWPVVDKFLADYPDVHIEICADNSLTDIVTERFDAGVPARRAGGERHDRRALRPSVAHGGDCIAIIFWRRMGSPRRRTTSRITNASICGCGVQVDCTSGSSRKTARK